MVSASQILFGTLSLLSPTLALPTNPLVLESRQTVNLPITLTAYAPDNTNLNGAKAQNGGSLFGEQVAQYCPTIVGDSCPNGTETVYWGGLTPSSMVPGGQDLYVSADGSIHITVQHSHYIPSDAYPSYQGWVYNTLPSANDTDPAPMPNCPLDDPRYNCDTPMGYYTFHAPDAPADVGGVVSCPYLDSPDHFSAYAVTPNFNRTDCTPMLGLGSHHYTGVNPPVWAY
ncbi:uncharacterized protein BKCO1_5700018 [Diplodia corticola]|uniref:IgE-binding protein n=1 Tax=Diplodia corticola TaxID=236234 RepID=A0A1J9QQG8_9PEZI|nr:uncharacterized protein BKCO1_5700018 [Diplodia corticola]OJD30704.1 hypothetical protein BKCO1_5700018 [Diplodia corticola]